MSVYCVPPLACTHLLTVPLPPVRTAPAILISFSRSMSTGRRQAQRLETIRGFTGQQKAARLLEDTEKNPKAGTHYPLPHHTTFPIQRYQALSGLEREVASVGARVSAKR